MNWKNRYFIITNWSEQARGERKNYTTSPPPPAPTALTKSTEAAGWWIFSLPCSPQPPPQWINKVACKFRLPCSQWSLNALTCWAIWRWEKSFHSHPSEVGCGTWTSQVKELGQGPHGSVESGAVCPSGWGRQAGLGTSLEELLNAICVPARVEAEVSSGGSCPWPNSKKCFPSTVGYTGHEEPVSKRQE